MVTATIVDLLKTASINKTITNSTSSGDSSTVDTTQQSIESPCTLRLRQVVTLAHCMQLCAATTINQKSSTNGPRSSVSSINVIALTHLIYLAVSKSTSTDANNLKNIPEELQELGKIPSGGPLDALLQGTVQLFNACLPPSPSSPSEAEMGTGMDKGLEEECRCTALRNIVNVAWTNSPDAIGES